MFDTSVLVVDDNATNRRILEQMLMNWGMSPATAESGELALEMMADAQAAGKPFPLVLVDANMPGMNGFTLTARIRQRPELTGATILMLTSANRRRDVERCRELGIAAYLPKPIKQSDLLNAIMTALGAPPAETDEATPTLPGALEAGQRRLRILLAEDNVVNREVAVRMLTKRGHSVRTVADGEEVLAALNSEGIDLVLMDVQMPRMDGFEATAAVRRSEAATGGHMPIVALTASAMKGDRERCLEAGMDGYVSKPLRASELFRAVEAPFTSVTERGDDSGNRGEPPQRGKFDREAALARVDGDSGLLHEIIGLFLAEAPELLSEIRQSVARHDGHALERASHKLKGSVANFDAGAPFDAAQRLERRGREGDFERAGEDYQVLESEIGRLQEAMAPVGGHGAT